MRISTVSLLEKSKSSRAKECRSESTKQQKKMRIRTKLDGKRASGYVHWKRMQDHRHICESQTHCQWEQCDFGTGWVSMPRTLRRVAALPIIWLEWDVECVELLECWNEAVSVGQVQVIIKWHPQSSAITTWDVTYVHNKYVCKFESTLDCITIVLRPIIT